MPGQQLWLDRALSGQIPRHVGIIMDGNGRWAERRGLRRSQGHREGLEALRKCIPALLNLGVEAATFFAFSTENKKRPKEEVDFLLGLILEYASKDASDLANKGVKLVPLGRWREFPGVVTRALENAAKRTVNGKRLTVYVALNYGGRQEIVDAASRMAEERGLEGGASERDFTRFLYEPSMPDVDLLIRTSGEKRISNFLLWQSAYAELVFTDVLWPDFGPEDMYKAVVEFQGRDRRYGGTGKGRG